MKGLPKRFATADDIRNCHALVKSGEISKEEMLEAMEQLEEQNYLHCPIRAVNGDTVTIGYCAEATAGGDAVVDGRELAIVSVTHNKGEAEEGMDAGFETTDIELSGNVSAEAKEIKVAAPYNIYDQLGITKEEFDEIKADLAA